MNTTVTTTLITRQDCAKLAALDCEIHADSWSDKQFRRYGKKGSRLSCHFERVYRSREIVGYCCIRELSHCVIVERFGVSPHYRRKGVGTKLLAHCIGTAMVSGQRMVRVCVDDRNEEALRFLFAIGFKPGAMLPGAFDDGDGCLFFYGVKESGR